MRKRFLIAVIMLCTITVAACGREMPPKIEAAKIPSPAPNSPAPSNEVPSSDTEPVKSAGTALPEDVRTFPATVAAYLNAAEALWKSDQEHVDYRTAFNHENLDQRLDISLEKDYNGEIILSEDFAKTGRFTLSLSVDGSADNLYVLEGNKAHASIVFGGAYRLGDTLYLGTGLADAPPFALNLETKMLTDCQKEYDTLQKLYSDYLQGQPESADLRIQYFHPIAQVENCLIYLAAVSESMDTDTRAVIYAAFDSTRSLKAYLLLTEADFLAPSKLTVTEQPGISMEISSLNAFTGTLTIGNTGEKTIGYGEAYILEKSMGGIWYPVSPLTPSDSAEHAWTDIMYTLETGDEAAITLRWDLFYPSLPAGSYRVIKNFSYPEDAGNKESFCLAVYFNME